MRIWDEARLKNSHCVMHMRREWLEWPRFMLYYEAGVQCQKIDKTSLNMLLPDVQVEQDMLNLAHSAPIGQSPVVSPRIQCLLTHTKSRGLVFTWIPDVFGPNRTLSLALQLLLVQQSNMCADGLGQITFHRGLQVWVCFYCPATGSMQS